MIEKTSNVAKIMRRAANMRRQALAAIAVAATVLALAACIPSGTGEQTPASGGVIAESILEPDHITPGRGNYNFGDVVHALFAPLVEYDENNNLANVQAESITTSDNKVWTVKIKPGWTFHNGEEVTSQSYVDAYNTIAYGPNAWGENYRFTNIEGYDALNPKEGQPTAKEMSGVKVVDPHTFQITLKEPDNQSVNLLFLAMYALPKVALADLAAYDKAPIGDGPFQMDGTWANPTDSIKVKAYEAYKGTKPKVSNVEFKVYSSAEAAYTDLLAGNVDLNGKYTAPPSSKLGQVKSDVSGRIVTSPQLYTQWLGFPLSDKRYSDIRVRQAVSMAIDRDAIISKIFGGMYTPATGIFAPGTIGGSPDSCGEYCKYDPAKAKALLEAAGGWSGPMEIQYAAGKGLESYVQAIANGIRQNLGISDVTLVASPNETEYLAALQTGAKGPFAEGWYGGSTPADILTGIFQKTSPYNYFTGFYSNPTVDSLIGQAKSAKTPEDATKLFHDAQAEIMKDFPVAPMFNYTSITAYSDRIEKPKVTLGGPMLDQIALK